MVFQEIALYSGFFQQAAFLKVWSLPDFKETVIPVPENRKVIEVLLLKDNLFLFTEVEDDSAKALSALRSELESRSEKGESIDPSEYYALRGKIDLILRTVKNSQLKGK